MTKLVWRSKIEDRRLREMVEGAAGKHGVTAADECFKLVVKWNGKKLDFELPAESATVGDVRKVLEAQTCVPCKRQKLVGLGKQPNPEDSVLLGALNLKNFQCSFMMIGAPDEAMMLQVSEIDDMPEVINDLDQDFAYDDEMTAALIANAGLCSQCYAGVQHVVIMHVHANK